MLTTIHLGAVLRRVREEQRPVGQAKEKQMKEHEIDLQAALAATRAERDAAQER